MDARQARARAGALAEKLERAARNLDMCIQVKRRIIEDLRPTTLANFGFMTAARELAEQTAERAGWKLNLDLPDDDPELPEETAIALYRILQETLNNAAKYAKATTVRIAWSATWESASSRSRTTEWASTRATCGRKLPGSSA
jgi:signal transduction histidine kinase